MWDLALDCAQPLFDDSPFLLARHPRIRRSPRGHLVESTKDSLAARPTVESTIEVVLPPDEPVVIGRPQIEFATSRQISFIRLRPHFTSGPRFFDLANQHRISFTINPNYTK